MRGDDDEVSSWRRSAEQTLGRTPNPDEVWDEYAHYTSLGFVQRRTAAVNGDEVRRSAGTYPAFSDLKAERAATERLVDVALPPIDTLLGKLFRSDYLDRKVELKRSRDRVRARYRPVHKRLQTAHRATLTELTTARVDRRWPDRSISDDKLDAIEDDVETVQELRHEEDRFLTGAEIQSIENIGDQFAAGVSYLETTRALNEVLGAAKAAVDAYESAVEPYADHDRYPPARDRSDLDTALSTAESAVGDLRTELDRTDGPMPENAGRAAEQYAEAVSNWRTELDDYEQLFLEN